MGRYASVFLLLILLSCAVQAQNNNAAAPAPAASAAQSGDTSENWIVGCGPPMGPDRKSEFPKASTILAGTLYDPKCRTVEDARVILIGGYSIQIVRSNSAGEFVFLDPKPKFCSLIVEKEGFKTTYVYGIEVPQLKHSEMRVPLEVGPSMEASPIGANAD